MNKIKKTLCSLFGLTLLTFSIITHGNVQAAERTEDLSNLVNYPEIYTAVQELKTAHPNWTFTILYTGLDWNDVIYNETTKLHSRSLVQNSIIVGNVSDWVCPTCGTKGYDNGSWYCASNKTVSYYMDPRNWLNESYIFAFETLSFNPNVHTIEGVEAIIEGTFMDVDSIPYINVEGGTQVLNKSYAEIIYEAGKTFNISPYHLAGRIRQEHGNGGSSLISGKTFTYTNPTTGEVSTYTGYYNYFNIGSYGNSTAEIIKNGLQRAKDKGWTNPEYSIYGGAEFLVDGYIGQYQDSLYLQKYHVDDSSPYSLYSHQYQQNVSAPFTESLDTYSAYEELGILDSNFNFIIPIYENMPSTASEKPGRKISLQTENVVVQTNLIPLSIRSGPSTYYTIKAQAPKGTTLIRIERAEQISSDGRYWDRVVYNTGSDLIIGYASREYLVDIATTETVNETATIGTMCNLRNGPATTNTRVKQILPVGTKVTIIDKINYEVDGHIWYRVKLEDGTQGYISSAYIQKKPEDMYKIEGSYMIIELGTNLSDIPGTILNGAITGTGANVTLNGTPYTLILLGDTNGDGKADSMDMYRIIQHILENLILEGPYFVAVDTNSDSKIDSMDMYNEIQMILRK